MKILKINSASKEEIIDITALVQDNISIDSGFVILYCPHTTAGITVNENFDPDVKHDFLLSINNIVRELDFKHMEGNSSSHVKSILVGKTLNLIIEKSKLKLGRWDGIYFCEFDGPRNREIWLKEFRQT